MMTAALKTTFSVLLLLVSFFLSLCLGSTPLSPHDLIAPNDAARVVIYEIRLPRAIASAIGGACLALSGLVLQTIFRNPLVDPYILGIASGAVFFIGLGVLLGITVLNVIPAMPVFAGCSVIGSLVTLAIISALARRLTTMQLLIAGVVISFLYSAGTHILISIAELERIAYFHLAVLGTFSGATLDRDIVAAAMAAPCVVALVLCSKWLNAMLMGETYAMTMGVNLSALRLTSVFATGVLTSASVLLGGIVGFIGLAAPHIARLLFRTSRVDVLLPQTVVIGAFLTLTSDVVARVVLLPRELTITAVTSLFGAPLLAYLVMRHRREYVI